MSEIKHDPNYASFEGQAVKHYIDFSNPPKEIPKEDDTNNILITIGLIIFIIFATFVTIIFMITGVWFVVTVIYFFFKTDKEQPTDKRIKESAFWWYYVIMYVVNYFQKK